MTVAGTTATVDDAGVCAGGDQCDGGGGQYRHLDGDDYAAEWVYRNRRLGRDLCGADDGGWLLQHHQHGGERDGSGDGDVDGVHELVGLLGCDDDTTSSAVTANVRRRFAVADACGWSFGGDADEGSVRVGADGSGVRGAAGGWVPRTAFAGHSAVDGGRIVRGAGFRDLGMQLGFVERIVFLVRFGDGCDGAGLQPYVDGDGLGQYGDYGVGANYGDGDGGCDDGNQLRRLLG